MLALYNYAESIDNIIMSLQESAKIIFHWFWDDQIKENNDKCHLVMRTTNSYKGLLENL